MRGLAGDDDVKIDAPLVADRNLAIRADKDDGVLRRLREVFHDTGNSIMTSGFAGSRQGEDKAPAQLTVFQCLFDRTKGGGQCSFLLGHTPPPDSLPPGRIDQRR
ncbi:hypothetical protein D9M68_976220 [compost metagenome]